MRRMTRRQAILVSAAGAVVAGRATLADVRPPVHVAKGTGCECCDAWVTYLREQGFTVTDEELYGTQLIRFKMDLGIPPDAFSCHTGTIDGYALEGHVPAADIMRLLSERPEAIGLAVPGMPYGSPGMGSENSRDAYDVLLVKRDGSTEVFARYPAA